MGLLSPNIIECEDGRIRITAHCYTIPELKNILDKYELNADPYLTYVYYMTALDSPYINLPEDEKSDTIVYDLSQTMGSFDPEEPLLKPAVEKLESLYSTTLMNYYKSLKVSIDKMAQYIRDTPIMEGKDGNLSEIIRIHKEAGSTLRSYKDIEKQVDEELTVKLRGNAQLGDY